MPGPEALGGDRALPEMRPQVEGQGAHMRRLRGAVDETAWTEGPRPVRNAVPPDLSARMPRPEQDVAVEVFAWSTISRPGYTLSGAEFAIRGSAPGTGAHHLVEARSGQHRLRPGFQLGSRSAAYPLPYSLG